MDEKINILSLPNLFIPGAAKSGTTTLWNYLAQHTQICLTYIKEPGYFGRRDRNPNDYRYHFHDCERTKYRADGSTRYMVLPEVAQKIKKDVDNPRFIFVLRNPVDRAWSHYWWFRANQRAENRPFREAFSSGIDREPSVDGLLANEKYYYHYGTFYKWLRIYFDTFPKESILVLDFDDLIVQPHDTLQSVWDFLGIIPLRNISLVHKNPTRFVRWGVVRRYYLQLTRLLGTMLRRMLSTQRFTQLAETNLKVQIWFFASESGSRPPTITDDDRMWVAEHYCEDVANLRKLTGMFFPTWERDFPSKS